MIPPDPAMAFLDELVEDYADEWLTKAMFHYRWAYAPDVAQGAAILPRWSRTDQDEEQSVALGKAFAERQVARLAVVGSNSTTSRRSRRSYRRLLHRLDALHEVSFARRKRPVRRLRLYAAHAARASSDARALALGSAAVSLGRRVDDLSGLTAPSDWTAREGAAPIGAAFELAALPRFRNAAAMAICASASEGSGRRSPTAVPYRRIFVRAPPHDPSR